MPFPEDLKGGHKARSDALPWTCFEIRSHNLRRALSSESYRLIWTCFELSRRSQEKIQRANKIILERKIPSLSSLKLSQQLRSIQLRIISRIRDASTDLVVLSGSAYSA